MPGPLTLDDLTLVGRTWYSTKMADLPARIAADPRLAELDRAARASGQNLISIMERTPVNRSGTVLSTANSFLQKYAPSLTPAGSEKATVTPTSAAPTLATANPVPGLTNEASIGSRAWQLYKGSNWGQLEAASQTDPFLKQLRAYAQSIGTDWKTVLSETATSGTGSAPGLKNYLLGAGQQAGTPYDAARAQQTNQLVKAAETQQTLAPTGPSKYSVGATTPHAPVSPTGTPQSTLTGQPTRPVNIPAVQQITQPDLAKTGVKVTEGGNALQTPGGAPVGLESVKNAFDPQMVRENKEELQLSRLPVGELVRQQQNKLNAMTNVPKPDQFALEQERLSSPFKIRQAALEKFRAGTLKPL